MRSLYKTPEVLKNCHQVNAFLLFYLKNPHDCFSILFKKPSTYGIREFDFITGPNFLMEAMPSFHDKIQIFPNIRSEKKFHLIINKPPKTTKKFTAALQRAADRFDRKKN